MRKWMRDARQRKGYTQAERRGLLGITERDHFRLCGEQRVELEAIDE